MNSKTKSKRIEYSVSRSGVFMSTVTAGLSIVFALLLLLNHLDLLLYYIVTTSLIAVAALVLRARISPILALESVEEVSFENEGDSRKREWIMILLLSCMIAVILILPMVLAGFMNPYVWFVLLISFTSGVSIAEVLFYVYVSRMISHED